MPKLYKSDDSHNERAGEWRQRLETIGTAPLPDGLQELLRSKNEKEPKQSSRYDRFVSYMQGWMLAIATNDKNGSSVLLDDERGESEIAVSDFPDKWWEFAIKAGKGGIMSDKMPVSPMAYDDEAEKEESKALLYDRIMPTYRALRESFNSRPWYQWFTNHAQYTAERDSMNALRGMILMLTGDSKEAFDSDYNEYHSHLTVENGENVAAPKEKVSNSERTKVEIHSLSDDQSSFSVEARHDLEESKSFDDSSYIGKY